MSGINVGILYIFLITLLQVKQPTQIDISIYYHTRNIWCVHFSFRPSCLEGFWFYVKFILLFTLNYPRRAYILLFLFLNGGNILFCHVDTHYPIIRFHNTLDYKMILRRRKTSNFNVILVLCCYPRVNVKHKCLTASRYWDI